MQDETENLAPVVEGESATGETASATGETASAEGAAAGNDGSTAGNDGSTAGNNGPADDAAAPGSATGAAETDGEAEAEAEGEEAKGVMPDDFAEGLLDGLTSVLNQFKQYEVAVEGDLWHALVNLYHAEERVRAHIASKV